MKMALKEYIDKGTRNTVLILLASVIVFNTLPKLGFIGQYFDKYPLILLLVGIGIIFYVSKDK